MEANTIVQNTWHISKFRNIIWLFKRIENLHENNMNETLKDKRLYLFPSLKNIYIKVRTNLNINSHDKILVNK